MSIIRLFSIISIMILLLTSCGFTKADNDSEIEELLNKSKIAYEQGNLEDAYLYAEKILKKDPKNTRAILIKSYIKFSNGEYEEALRLDIEAYKIKPTDYMVLRSLAATYNKLGRYDKAIDILKQCQKIYPTDPRTKFLLGLNYIDIKEYTKAEEIFLTLTKGNVTKRAGHYGMGRLLKDMGKYKESVPQFEKALKLEGPLVSDEDILLHMAGSTYLIGEYAEAKTLCKEIISINPNNLHALNMLGEIAEKENDFEKAVHFYTKSYPVDHDVVKKICNMADILTRDESYEKAIYCYKVALNLNRKYKEAHNNLGVAFLYAGQLEEAINEFNIAISLDSEFAEPYYNLACVYSKKKDIDQSLKYLEKAFRLSRDLAEYSLDDQGLTYIRNDIKYKELVNTYLHHKGKLMSQ